MAKALGALVTRFGVQPCQQVVNSNFAVCDNHRPRNNYLKKFP